MRSTRIRGKSWRWVLSSVPGPALLVAAFVDGTPTPAHADDLSVVAWRHIVGIIEPLGIVGRRSGGIECEINVDCAEGTPAPWIVSSGNAAVDVTSGEVRFTVRGLVVAGDPSFSNLGTTTENPRELLELRHVARSLPIRARWTAGAAGSDHAGISLCRVEPGGQSGR